jgi:hypothetical protein
MRGEAEEKGPRLEFRILANKQDEPKALEAASKYLAAASKDAKRKKELEEQAKGGQPPPVPKAKTAKAPGYTWVELGPSELRFVQLNNEVANDKEKNGLWKKAAAARAKGQALLLGTTGRLHDCLLYSRRCLNTKLPAKERAKKKYDYFLLTRDPHKGKAVTGRHLVELQAVESKPLRFQGEVIRHRGLRIRLSKAGGELMHQLTSENLPTPAEKDDDLECERHLAIIVDGRIISAPRNRKALRADVEFSGEFTKKEVEAFVKVLRRDMPKKGKK